MTKPKPGILQAGPRSPKTAGPRNGLPEVKPYRHDPKPAPAGAPGEGGGHPYSASVAESNAAGYKCPECGARTEVGQRVRPAHKPGCRRGARLSLLLRVEGEADSGAHRAAMDGAGGVLARARQERSEGNGPEAA